MQRGGELLKARTCVRELRATVRSKGGVLILADLTFPFAEEVAGHLIDLADLTAHLRGLRLAVLVFGFELVVGAFEVAAAVAGELLELRERILKLLAGLLLLAAGRFHGADEQVTLLPAQLFPGGVVNRVARREDEGGDEEEALHGRRLFSRQTSPSPQEQSRRPWRHAGHRSRRNSWVRQQEHRWRSAGRFRSSRPRPRHR